jgi:hypothetical protein
MTSELKSMLGENYAEQSPIPSQNIQKEMERKTKDYIKKQTGLKRELIKLIGGVPCIVERTNNKSTKKSNWVLCKFKNIARSDNLLLEHWQKKEEMGYQYDTRCNKVEIVEFTKDEYEKLIKPNDRNWNYEQTIYLWDLLRQYNLNFIIAYDRFDEATYGERTVETLKDRYYSVARIILEHRRLFDHPIIKSGYNYEQEIKRRTYLEKTMNKSFAELKEENYLMELAENLNKKMEKNENLEKALQQKLDELPTINNNQPQNSMILEEKENSINNLNINNIQENSKMNVEPFGEANNGQTFEDFIKNNITKNDSFVYLRSQKLKHNLPVSEKIQERVDTYIKELNIPEKLIPTAKVEMAYDNLRNNVILYTSLKKYLDKKEKEYAFLQKKFQDYQQKKQPSQIQNQMPIPSHSQAVRNVQRSEKNLPLSKSLNPRTQNEIKDQEQSLNPQAKNIQNMNNAHVSINNSQKVEEIPMINNVANSTNVDTKNTNQTNNINANNEQQDNKQNGHKEKRKRIQATPKAKKRKNANDEEVPDEEKEPKSNSKKKKKGTK